MNFNPKSNLKTCGSIEAKVWLAAPGRPGAFLRSLNAAQRDQRLEKLRCAEVVHLPEVLRSGKASQFRSHISNDIHRNGRYHSELDEKAWSSLLATHIFPKHTVS